MVFLWDIGFFVQMHPKTGLISVFAPIQNPNIWFCASGSSSTFFFKSYLIISVVKTRAFVRSRSVQRSHVVTQHINSHAHHQLACIFVFANNSKPKASVSFFVCTQKSEMSDMLFFSTCRFCEDRPQAMYVSTFSYRHAAMFLGSELLLVVETRLGLFGCLRVPSHHRT